MLIPARIPTGPTDVESSSYGDTNLFWLLEIRQHRRFSCLFGSRRSGVLIATDDVTVDASSGWRAITDVNYVHRDYKQMR